MNYVRVEYRPANMKHPLKPNRFPQPFDIMTIYALYQTMVD